MKMTLVGIKILLIMTLIITLSGCSNNESALINETGYAQYVAGQYQEAVDTYTSGIEIDPDYMDFYTNRGMAYYELGQVEEALADLNYVIAQVAITPEAYANRGTIYLGTGNEQVALNDFYKAIEQKEHFEVPDGLYYTYLNLGTLLNAIGEKNEALEVYFLARELKDDEPALFNAIGLLYKGLGDYDLAITNINIALDMDQSYGYAYGNRASVYLEMGELEFALSDANTALSIDPYIPQVYDIKAKTLVALGELDLAKKTISDGTSIWISYGDLYITLANIYMTEADYGQALINYGLGVRYGNPEGYKGQGVAYRIIEQYDDAIVSMRAYLESNPSDIVARAEIGMSQQGLMRHEEAIETFDEILSIVPEHNDALYYQALSYEYMEDYNKAIELLKDVINNDDTYEKAQDELDFINEHLIK